MELILSNHSSFPRIGDHADLQVLRKTIGQFEKGQKNQADLRAAEDRMTDLASVYTREFGVAPRFAPAFMPGPSSSASVATRSGRSPISAIR